MNTLPPKPNGRPLSSQPGGQGDILPPSAEPLDGQRAPNTGQPVVNPCRSSEPLIPEARATPECLLRRIPSLRRYLQGRGFRGIVIERAIDRAVAAAVKHLQSGRADAMQNRVAWLYRLTFLIARQVAQREVPCVLVEPSALDAVGSNSADDELALVIAQALEKLTRRQRDAVYYCVMLGLSPADAARTIGSAKGRMVAHHRNVGVERLKKILPAMLRTLDKSSLVALRLFIGE